mgnify:CR=1 FL=1
MKINEVTAIEARSEIDNFDLTDQQRKVVAIGRQMMDIAAKAKDETQSYTVCIAKVHQKVWSGPSG